MEEYYDENVVEEDDMVIQDVVLEDLVMFVVEILVIAEKLEKIKQNCTVSWLRWRH